MPQRFSYWCSFRYATLLLSVFLISCIMVVPKTKENKKCDLVIKEIKLDVVSSELVSPSERGCLYARCIIAYVVGFATTGIILGSIALVGNALHWVEKKGRCNDTDERKGKDFIEDKIDKEGGTKLESMEEEDRKRNATQ